MPYPAIVFSVFIASPGDVQNERDTIRKVIQEWNDLNTKSKQIVLMPIRWEINSSPEMNSSGEGGQAIINKRNLKDCDLLIAVFWQRLGTPTTKAQSGTVEEIEEHIHSGKPAMVYFSQADLPQNHNKEQFEALQKFKQDCFNRGLAWEYRPDKFEDLIRNHLTLKVNEHEIFTLTNSVQQTISKPELSATAKEFLLALTEDDNSGEILLRMALGYRGLIVGKRQREYTNSRIQADYEGALKELTEMGLIQTTNNQIWNITSNGYKAGEEIRRVSAQ